MFFFNKSQSFFLLFQIIKIVFEVFYFFLRSFFSKFHCNFTAILTAFLCLIRFEASHEAYMNNLGNTFMAAIPCTSSLNLTHMNLGTYQ